MTHFQPKQLYPHCNILWSLETITRLFFLTSSALRYTDRRFVLIQPLTPPIRNIQPPPVKMHTPSERKDAKTFTCFHGKNARNPRKKGHESS
jgi:hypothetical protein